MDADAVGRAVSTVAHGILSEFGTCVGGIALVGIQLRGVPIASRIALEIERASGLRPMMGTIDISMYRDDVGLRKKLPLLKQTLIPFDMNGTDIVLVDDVVFTGRTVRAALDALTDYGRPRLIRLATLVDRGCREYPIRPDYVGATFKIKKEIKVRVRIQETDGVDGVFTCSRHKTK